MSLFSYCSVEGVCVCEREAEDLTMGRGTGPAMTVMSFNPGSRLKEKSQDAAQNH